MNLNLTKGMDGDLVEEIATSDDISVLMVAMQKWKDKNKGNYKVEPYNRFLFHKEDGKLIIDFGDYSYFLLINGIVDWSTVNNVFK